MLRQELSFVLGASEELDEMIFCDSSAYHSRCVCNYIGTVLFVFKYITICICLYKNRARALLV